jgi:hypothetical protein
MTAPTAALLCIGVLLLSLQVALWLEQPKLLVLWDRLGNLLLLIDTSASA